MPVSLLPSAAYGPHSGAVSVSVAPALGRQNHTGDKGEEISCDVHVEKSYSAFEIIDKWNIANFLNP